MGSMYDLGSMNLLIPVWQMAFYVALVTFFMVCRNIKFCLFTTYVFALYWGYYLFGGELISAVRGNPAVETAYIGFGLALAAFCLMALFYEER